MLARSFPEVRFIQSKDNVGFARANNLGFSVSRGKNLVFLNPDTELVGPAINILFEQMEYAPGAGVLGCRLLNGDGSVQTSCVQSMPTILNQVLDAEILRSQFPCSRLWGMGPLYDDTGDINEVEAISGACMMVKREVFEQVGMFSADYFMYAEDIDLCHKVRQHGYRNYYVPAASITHYGGCSSRKSIDQFSTVMMKESIWCFFKKTRGGLYASAYRAAMAGAAGCRIALLILSMPFARFVAKHGTVSESLHKWTSILRWGFCMQGWLRSYRA
jgi:GT2 family glycosyltransferase